MGNIVQVQQVNGGSSLFTQYYYDSQGRLLRMYKGLTSPLTISGLDNYATTGDNNFEVTKYTYDFYGNVKTYTNGTENTESYTYNDLTGQLLVKTLANGDQMTYTYDNAGNVLTITGAQTDKTTLEYTYTYDLTGNVTKAKNGDCETTYEYDDMGRCISETDKYYSGNTYVKNYAYSGKNISDYYLYKNNSLQGHECYEYESNGRLTGQIYSHNDNIEAFKDYFDPNGNVILHVAVQDQMDVLPLTINTYNMANLATFTQYWTGVKNSLGIDMGGSENYDYRLDGNLVGDVRIWIANSATNTVDYTSYNYYDGLSRLKTESYSRYDSTGLSSQWTDTYYFDDYNNRTGLTHTDQLNNTRSSQTTSNYDNSNRLKNQTITTNGTATTNDFDYDDAGNLKSKKSKVTGGSETTTQYTYDALNQLTGVNTGSTSTTFRYDSLGQRINKTSGSVTTESVWNQGRLSTDYVTNGSNTTFRQYTLNNEGVLIGDNGAYINYLNAQGNVAFYQDTSNTFTACNYDAYGNNTTGVSASSPYGYRNQYYDSETGLYYLNARYYDPTTGTFTQEDTYWGSTNSPATLNLYGYCGGNPVMASDPSGHHFDIGDTVNVSGVGTADSEGHGKTIEFNVDSMKITGHKNGRYQMSDRDGPVGWFTEDQLWYGPDVSNGVVDNGSPSGGSGGGSGGVTPGPSGVSSKDGHSSDNGSGNSNTSSDNSNQTISQGSPPPKTSGSWFISGEEAQKLGYTTTDGDTSGWCIKGGGIQISISGSFGGWNLSFTAILVWYTSDSFSYEPGLYSPFCPKGIPYIYVCVELDGGFADFNKILASLVEITTPQGARNILTGLLGPGYSFSIGAFVIWGNNQFRNAYDFTGVSTNVSATYNHVTAFGSKSSSYYTVGAGYSSAWIGGSYGHSDTWLVNPKYVQDLLGVRY
jgi:RHS repeat-associated core domain